MVGEFFTAAFIALGIASAVIFLVVRAIRGGKDEVDETVYDEANAEFYTDEPVVSPVDNQVGKRPSLLNYALDHGVSRNEIVAFQQAVSKMPPNLSYADYVDRYLNPLAYETDAERERRLNLEEIGGSFGPKPRA